MTIDKKLQHGLFKKLLIFSVFLLLLPTHLRAQSLNTNLNKTWLVRTQVLPELGHVFLSVEWSYLDLSGKEDDLLKRDILVIQKEYFWQKKRKLKKSITLEGVKLDLEVTSSKNPHPYPNAPDYLPRVVFFIDGKKKGDFHFGEYDKGRLFFETLAFNMKLGYCHASIVELVGHKLAFGLSSAKSYFTSNEMIGEEVIRSKIYWRQRK